MNNAKRSTHPSDEAPATATNGQGDVCGAAPKADGPNAQADAAAAESLRGELDQARDKLLRAQADFDNYQKRVLRERAEERRYAFLPLLRDLLSVRDNLQRALDAAEESGSQTSLLEGVRMVAQQLRTVFEQYGCREITAQGAEFDPHLHDALTMQPSQEPAGRVLSVFRPGYQLHDRVVRPAQVVVSSGPAKPASE
jgi:molecular chaperone GrpE